MNISKYISTLLLGIAVTIGIVSCSSDKYQEPAETFAVVKAEFPSAFTAGEGFIELSEEGFAISSEDESWLTAELESPRRVKVKLAKNEQSESRTANVILTKGQTRLLVPVTQVGVINQATLADQTFGRRGGSYEVSLTQMDSEPQIEYTADWVSHSIQDGKLLFAVTPLAPADPDREVRIRVTAGLFNRTISFRQIYGAPSFTDLLGAYTLSYILEAGAERQERDVQLVVNEAGKSFRLSGVHNLVVTYNEVTGVMRIAPQNLTGGHAEDKAYAWLSFYDGKANLSTHESHYFEAAWDKNEANPGFTFAAPNKMLVQEDDGSTAGYTPRGLAFYNLSEGRGWVRQGDAPIAITDFSLTKK